jgi:hypothetical protein
MKAGIAIALTLPLCAQLTYDRILKSAAEPGNWLTYSGNYAAHRYSPLDSINENNVRNPGRYGFIRPVPCTNSRRRRWSLTV